MPSQEKKPKLNRQAKALFMLHNPYTIEKHELKKIDYLKYPKISKEFLFVANSQKIYSLSLSSSFSETYRVEIQNVVNEKLDDTNYNTFKCNFGQLKKLSKWFNIGFLNLRFEILCDLSENALNEQIEGFREIWAEVYPDAKINLFCFPQLKFETVLSLVEELSPRLYNLEYWASVLIETPQKLTLNSCVFNKGVSMLGLQKLMERDHEIKKLNIRLGKSWENEASIPQEYLNNFRTNFALKELEIEYRTNNMEEKGFNELTIESLLEFLPNLTSLCLSFNFEEHDFDVCSFNLEDAQRVASNALNHIQKLRSHLSQKRPSIDLKIFYSFNIKAVTEGFEKFDEWAETLVNHSDLSSANKIEPAFDFYPNQGIALKNLEIFGPPQDEKYYKYTDGSYHLVTLKWKHSNFTGVLFIHVRNYGDLEEEED